MVSTLIVSTAAGFSMLDPSSETISCDREVQPPNTKIISDSGKACIRILEYAQNDLSLDVTVLFTKLYAWDVVRSLI